MAKKKRGREGRHPMARFLLLIYGAMMIWLLFGQRLGNPVPESYEEALKASMNIYPLATVRHYIHLLSGNYSPYLQQHAFINLVGNVVMFVPLGALLPGIWKKWRKFLPFLLRVTGMILLVEVVQLFSLLGSFDVDDLLLNLIGVCIGFLVWKRFFSRKTKK